MVHEHPWAFPEAVQSGVSESTCLKPGLTRPVECRHSVCDMRLSGTGPAAQKNATLSRFPAEAPLCPRRLRPLRLASSSFQKNRLSTIHQPSSPQTIGHLHAGSFYTQQRHPSSCSWKGLFALPFVQRTSYLIGALHFSHPFTFRPPRRFFLPLPFRFSRTATIPACRLY